VIPLITNAFTSLEPYLSLVISPLTRLLSLQARLFSRRCLPVFHLFPFYTLDLRSFRSPQHFSRQTQCFPAPVEGFLVLRSSKQASFFLNSQQSFLDSFSVGFPPPRRPNVDASGRNFASFRDWTFFSFEGFAKGTLRSSSCLRPP